MISGFGGDYQHQKANNVFRMSLTCSNCGFISPPGMRFCGKCGSQLTQSGFEPVKPELSNSQNIGILMGSDLKQRFQQAGIEAAGQRRSVTVLFADLCDYTGLGGKIDDETLYEIIQLYLRMLADKVYRYEGMVDKITGDGLMALFGAPIAHENPAERAVRAAIEMRDDLQILNQDFEEQLGEQLQMRIGLNRGTVIVGGVGADLMMDYTAIGNTVNLARRLEESAPEDAILVSESVYQSTRALFDYRQETDLTLKGYHQDERGYTLLGVKTQPEGVRGLEGLRSPMVGREAELEILKSALDGLSNNKRGQFVGLVGEAGIGKSRLTDEFKSRINEERFVVLEGQSLTYRRSVSYWIFLDLLWNYLGVTAATSSEEVQIRLQEIVSQVLGPNAGEVLPFLEHLLYLNSGQGLFSQRLEYLEAEQLQQQVFIAFREFLYALAKEKPLVVILEDLHWADEVSLNFLTFLSESIEKESILVLAISRPEKGGDLDEIFELYKQQLGEACQIIHLQNLSGEQSDQLLSGLLGLPEIPEPFRNQILDKAAGVPFYIEEILRMLIDQGILVEADGEWQFLHSHELDFEVPENLQDLILARFDRLPPLQRNILQTASVIGRQFNTDLLLQVMRFGKAAQLDEILSSLVERAFLLPAAGTGEKDFLFRHVLTSDAVYRTLLRRDRNILHGLVAQELEKLFAERIESQVEVLAGHYLRSDYLEKALHYLILAGQKSARGYANLQAKGYFEEAKNLFEQVSYSPEQALQVWTGLGDVLVFVGEYEQARECYLEALTENQSSEGGKSLSIIHRKIAITFERQGEFDRSLAHLDQANEVLCAAEDSSPVSKANILNDKGWIYFLRGNFEQANEMLQSALNLVENTENFSVVASVLNRLGAVSYQLREYKQAARYVRKSLEIRKTLGDISGEARLYNNLGLLGLMSGELREAKQNFDRSIELLEKVGDTEGIALANINLGLVKYELGDYESATFHLEKAQTVAEKIGHRFYLGLATLYQGRLKSAQGGYEQAVELLNESLQIFEELGAQDNLIDALCYLAENYLTSGEFDEAIIWSEKAQQALDENLAEDSVQAGRVYRIQGAIARFQGDLVHSANLLLESTQIFRAAYEKLESARTSYELGLLALELADIDGAQEYFSEARDTFSEVGADKELQRVESTMNKIAVLESNN